MHTRLATVFGGSGARALTRAHNVQTLPVVKQVPEQRGIVGIA